MYINTTLQNSIIFFSSAFLNPISISLRENRLWAECSDRNRKPYNACKMWQLHCRLWRFIRTGQNILIKGVKRGMNRSRGCTLLPRGFGKSVVELCGGSWLAVTWRTSKVASGTTTECCAVTSWLHRWRKKWTGSFTFDSGGTSSFKAGQELFYRWTCERAHKKWMCSWRVRFMSPSKSLRSLCGACHVFTCAVPVSLVFDCGRFATFPLHGVVPHVKTVFLTGVISALCHQGGWADGIRNIVKRRNRIETRPIIDKH